MDIVISRKDLLPYIEAGRAVADSKSPVPALANVLIAAEGKQVRIAATDLYMQFTASGEAEVNEAGAVALPAKDLLERVKALPDGPIQIKTANGQTIVRAVGHARRYSMTGLDASDYPALPQPSSETWHVLPAALLRAVLRRVRDAISTDETRAHVNSALLSADGEKMTAVATDGHRLHLARAACSARFEQILVPLKAVAELLRLLDKVSGDVEVNIDRHLFVRFGGMLWGCKLVEAAFPPYQQVIPQRPSNGSVVREALASAAKAVAIGAGDKEASIMLHFAPNVLRIVASSPETGSAEDEVPATYAGSDTKIGMNARYLDHALSAIDAEEVMLSVAGELDPMVVSTADKDYLAVLMPRRV